MKIVGHRGARGLAPENTIKGLQKGLEHHVDELEFDLRVTKDAVVILQHDAFLSDASGRRLLITHHTYAELLEHKPDLATFNAVLETIGGQLPLYIEVKPKVPVQPIVKMIKKHLAADGNTELISLGSKSQKTLLQLHAALPGIKKIVIQPWSGVIAARRARQLDTKFISMNQLFLWSGFIKMMSRRGWKLYTFSLNNPKKAKRWARHGLYAVVTDYPDRFEP